jgi:polysaccharide biosynthesis/export protein
VFPKPLQSRIVCRGSVVVLLALGALRAGAQTAAGASSTDFALAPGDIVRIAVWREPDLSGDFTLDESGVVTFPMLGKMNLLRIPVSQLRDTLIARFAADLKNPSVAITPLRRIYVLGEVAKPGMYTIDPTITLSGAIAMAGGATSNGDLGRIRVVRNNAVISERVALGTAIGSMNVRSDDQIFVDRRSWFDRNSTFALSAVLSLATLAITLVVARQSGK